MPWKTEEHHTENAYVTRSVIKVCEGTISGKRSCKPTTEELITNSGHLIGYLISLPDVILIGNSNEITHRSMHG